jgi:hypothetical protein
MADRFASTSTAAAEISIVELRESNAFDVGQTSSVRISNEHWDKQILRVGIEQTSSIDLNRRG